MDGIKKLMAFFAMIMVVIAFAAPAIAQGYGDRMAQPQAGGQQAMPAQGGQGQQGGMKQSNQDLMATMDGRTDISMFTAAVRAMGYDQMLGQQGQGQGQDQSQSQNPYMVFAPTDEVLQRDMGVTDVNALMADENMLKSLVDNCIVSQVNQPAEGSKTLTMTSIGGTKITAMKSNTGITVNGIKIVDAVMATNGLLAVTDGVVGMRGAAVKPSVMPSVAPPMRPGGMRGMPGGMQGGMSGYS